MSRKIVLFGALSLCVALLVSFLSQPLTDRKSASANPVAEAAQAERETKKSQPRTPARSDATEARPVSDASTPRPQASRLGADDFERRYTPPNHRHEFGLNPPQRGNAQYAYRNGLPTMTGGREPLEFVAGWERETNQLETVDRTWIVRDPNLPKYQLTRIDQQIRKIPGGEVVEKETAFVADHVVVKLGENRTIDELERLMLGWGASVRSQLRLTGAYLLTFDGTEPGAREAFLRDLNAESAVVFAEPDGHAELTRYTPRDPRFNRLWGLDNSGQTGGTPDFDIDAPEAWNASRGSQDVIVGVIDTGIDYTHPDLAANMWVNAGETGVDAFGQAKSRNGADDDGNGFIDDVHGYDFVNNDPDPLDEHFHGTHVAGTIGAVGDNEEGVVGVNHNVRLIALKIFHTSGRGDVSAFLSDVAEAITYATDAGAQLTNNSYGGSSTSQLVADAISDANDNGSLFVVAAGNSGLDLNRNDRWPAKYRLPNVISVAATDANGNIAGFSNFGTNFVDIGAPGVEVYSTIPTQSYPDPYGALSGTSMASPHTAGVAALLFAAEPSLTALQVRQLIIDSVEPNEDLQGKTLTGGHLNAANALRTLSLTINDIAIVEDGSAGSSGNGDGIFNPGERIAITLELDNRTEDAFTSVTATLDDLGNSLVQTQSSNITFGTIGSGGSSTGDTAFVVELTDQGLLPAVVILPVTISSDQRTFRSTVLFEISESRSISGQVTVDGNPAEGAEIQWRRLPDPNRPERGALVANGTAATAADGTFSLTIPDGEYELVGVFEGVEAAARTLTVPPDASDVDFAFRSTTITGTVTNRRTGAPLEGVTIVYDGALEGEVSTNANGDYAIDAILAETGEVRLQARTEAFTISPWKRVVLPPNPAAVDFRLGAPTLNVSAKRLELAAAPGSNATQSFTVRNDGDEPLTFGTFNRDIQLRERTSGKGQVSRRFDLPSELHNSLPYWPRNYGIAHDGEHLWILNGTHNLYRINEQNGSLLETIPLDLPEDAVPSKLTWDGRYLWFTSYIDRSVYCYDLGKRSIIRSWEIDSDDFGHFPAGITFARQRLWIHRAPFLALDFLFRYAAFDPETGEYEDAWTFLPDGANGRSHVIEFDNGTFWHGGTEHPDRPIYRGLDDPREHPSNATVDFTTAQFKQAMPNIYDMAADREGRFWMVGSTNQTIRDDDNHIDIARQTHTHELWLTQSPHQVTLQPGESTEIEVRADGSKIGSGTHEATFVLRTNDPASPQHEVEVRFDVDPGLSGNGTPNIAQFTVAPSDNLTWPNNVAELTVLASDPDNDELTYTWRKLAGPGTISFSENENSSATTNATMSAPGTYRIEVQASDGQADDSETVTVTIAADHLVSGSVTRDGQPFADARVVFTGPVSGEVPTDPTGSYELRLPAGEFTLQALATNALPSSPRAYTAGDPAPDFNFSTVALEGVVTGSLSGAVASDADVTIVWAGAEIESAAVDDQGRFAFDLLTGQTTDLTLEATQRELIGVTSVTVPPGDTDIELALREPDIDPAPASLSVALAHGETAQRKLTLHNLGDGPLRWVIWPQIIGEDVGRIAEAGDRLVWETYEVGWPFEYLEGVAYDGKHLFIGRNGARVIRCEPLTGRVLEVFKPSNDIGMGDMTYDPTRDVIWYSDNSIGANNKTIETVYAMDPADGTIVDTVNIPFANARAMDFHDGLLYLAIQPEVRDSADIVGFDLVSGEEVSRITIESTHLVSWINFHNGLLWWSQFHSANVRFSDPFDGSRIGFVNQPFGSPFHDSAMLGDGTIWGAHVSDYVRWDLGTSGWLSTDPTSGFISPGETSDVTVTLDSNKTGLGTFAGKLIARSNDPDEPALEIPVQLAVGEPAQTLSGTVTRDGQPVEGATVKLIGDLRSITTTDSSGQYVFAVGDGRYEVQARMDGWQEQPWQNVIVDGANASDVDFEWTTGTVSGVVRESLSGDFLPRAEVTYDGPFSGTLESSAGNGSFAITHVFSQPSQLQITASFDGTDHVAAVAVDMPGNLSQDLIIFGADAEIDPPAFTVQEQLADVTTRTMSVSNVGFEDGLDWSLDGLDAISWLSADITSRTGQRDGTTVDVTLTFNPGASPGIGTHEAGFQFTTNDPNDNRRIPVTLIVTAENDAPTATITAPETESIVGTENLIISAEASDIDGVMDRIEFYADERKIGEVPNPNPGTKTMTADFHWEEASVGNYEITARGVDDDSGIGEDIIALRVTRNPVPVINFERFPGGAPVRVSFTSEGSHDPDGSIADFRWDRDEPLSELSLNGGYVVVEAEHIQADHREWDGSGEWTEHFYEVVEDPDASNGQAVQGLPDIGEDEFRNNLDPKGTSSSPQMRWKALSPTDTKRDVYLWVRYKGTGPDSNLMNLGFFGSFSFYGGPYESNSNDYVWQRTGGFETFNSKNPTVNVRMEEDGVLFDKLLLTTDRNFTPTGLGPLQETPGVWSRTEDAAFTFTEDGEYTVYLTVTDDLGVQGTASATIIVGEPPNVAFTASPQSGSGPLTVNFNAGATTGDAQIVRYAWNLGDSESTGEIDLFRPSDRYDPDEPNTGDAEVTAQGELELAGDVWLSLLYDYDVTPNTRLRFEYRRSEAGELQAIGLDDNAEHDDTTRLFKIDGSNGSRPFFDRSQPAYDGSGDWVRYEIPVGEFYTGTMSRLVFVQVDSGFVDPASSSFRNLELIESTLASGVTASHTYNDPGEYPVSLTVTDSRGLTATQVQTITVAEPVGEPPAITAFNATPTAIYQHGTVLLETEASDPEGDPLDYRWFAGSTALGNWQTSHRMRSELSEPGSHILRAQVRDADENIVEASTNVSVEPFSGTGTNADLLPDFARFMASRVRPGQPLPPLDTDVNGNGLPLLIDYLFMQPEDGGHMDRLPHLSGAAGSDLLLRFVRRAGVDPELISFSWSADMQQWQPYQPSDWTIDSTTSDESGGEAVTVRLMDAAEEQRMFVRTHFELPVPPFTGVIRFEAEDGDLGANWRIHSDHPEASDGRYIEIHGLNRISQPPSQDRPDDNVRYTFTIPEGEGSDFDLWFRILSTGGADDSFFWRLNGGPWNQVNGLRGVNWHNVNTTAFDALPAGSHRFEITYREDGTQLDAFSIQRASEPAP